MFCSKEDAVESWDRVFQYPQGQIDGCTHAGIGRSGMSWWFCLVCELAVDLVDPVGFAVFYDPERGQRTWWREREPGCPVCGLPMGVERRDSDTPGVFRWALVCMNPAVVDEHPLVGWSDTVHGLVELHTDAMKAAR